MLTTTPLTEGDFVRGGPPELELCLVVDPRSGAACTLPEDHPGETHAGTEYMTSRRKLFRLRAGSVTTERAVRWSGGTERAVVAEAERWVRVPGTDVEVRTRGPRSAALLTRPAARRCRF